MSPSASAQALPTSKTSSCGKLEPATIHESQPRVRATGSALQTACDPMFESARAPPSLRFRLRDSQLPQPGQRLDLVRSDSATAAISRSKLFCHRLRGILLPETRAHVAQSCAHSVLGLGMNKVGQAAHFCRCRREGIASCAVVGEIRSTWSACETCAGEADTATSTAPFTNHADRAAIGLLKHAPENFARKNPSLEVFSRRRRTEIRHPR